MSQDQDLTREDERADTVREARIDDFEDETPVEIKEKAQIEGLEKTQEETRAEAQEETRAKAQEETRAEAQEEAQEEARESRPSGLLSALTIILICLVTSLGFGLWHVITQHHKLSLPPSDVSLERFESRVRARARYAELWGWLTPELLAVHRDQEVKHRSLLLRDRALKLMELLRAEASPDPLSWPERPIIADLHTLLTHRSHLYNELRSAKDVVDTPLERSLKRAVLNLESWSKRLRSAVQSRDEDPADEAAYAWVQLEASLTTRDERVHVEREEPLTEAMTRYRLHHYQRWFELALERARSRDLLTLGDVDLSDQETHTLDASLAESGVDQLARLQGLTRALSRDLWGVVALANQRELKGRWRHLWSQHVNAMSAQPDPELVLAHLYRFATSVVYIAERAHVEFKNPELKSQTRLLARPLTDPSAQLSLSVFEHRAKEVAVPQSVVEDWIDQLKRIDLSWLTLTTHDRLERAYQTESTSTQDPPRSIKERLADLWYVHFLSSDRYQALLISLKSFELRNDVRSTLQTRVWSQAYTQRLKEQSRALEELSPSAAEIARELRELVELKWRSFSGDVTCDPAQVSSGLKWRDVSLLDRLDPYLLLGYQLDQAKLSGRTGRLQWGLSSSAQTRLEVWDHDRISSDDLLFDLPLPSPYALIMSHHFNQGGCRWHLSLQTSEALKVWIGSGILPDLGSR